MVYVLLPPLKMERPKKLKDEKEGEKVFGVSFRFEKDDIVSTSEDMKSGTARW